MSAPTDPSNPGLLFGPGPEGWWDSERCSAPTVLRLPDGTWRMYYYGRDATFDRAINFPAGRSGVAESTDGVRWTRVRGPLTLGAVFEPSADPTRFDCGHVGFTDVHWHNGLFWAFYLGGGQDVMDGPGPFKVKGFPMRPGCAISRDGLHWVRLDGPARGALLDVGGPGAFDRILVNWPRVVIDEENWKLYYHSRNPEGGSTVGLAISEDGLRWRKVGPVIGTGEPGRWDDGGVSCRHVIRHEGRYLMFYEGRNRAGYYCIGLATSDDGAHWTKDDQGDEPGGPYFRHAPPGSGRWDARAVGTPYVVPMDDGSFRLYYVGVNEGGHDELSSKHQIGMAVSSGSDYRSWRRWNDESRP